MILFACPLFWFLIFAFPRPASALEIPEPPENYVSDTAALLSSQARENLETLLRQYEAKTTNQILVVTFPGLEGESLEDFSIRLAEKWKPGQKEKDNGVLFLVFKEERKMRIEVGYGLEGALPDAAAGLILQNHVAPNFRQEDYERGILEGVAAIIRATEGEFSSEESKPSLTGDLSRLKIRGDVVLGVVFALALIFFVIDLFRYRAYLFDHRIYRQGYTFWEWWFRFSLLLFVLKMLFEVVYYSLLYSRGGYYGSRGGFGGTRGGGGSFGGGGASGRW